MHLRAPVPQLARQHDDLADDEFRHAARGAERRIEDRHAARVGFAQRHLVGADAERAHRQQPPRLGQHGGRDERAAAHAEQVHLPDPGAEFLLAQGGRRAASTWNPSAPNASTALGATFSSSSTLI